MKDIFQSEDASVDVDGHSNTKADILTDRPKYVNTVVPFERGTLARCNRTV